ncbi:hypothetical protein MTR67_026737, partial [Solanum verrucosum]
GLNTLEQKAKFDPSANRQVDLVILRPSFLRSFQPFRFFLGCNVHAFLQTSNT